MTIDVRILRDREGFLAGYLDDLRQRLARMGARRVGKGRKGYRILTPDGTPARDVVL